MRNFTPKEKKFIEKIIATKNKGDLSAFKELELAKLVRNYLAAIVIEWEVGENPSVTIYSEKNTPGDISSYFKIADFLSFIDELKEYKYIRVDHYGNQKERRLYDQDKYSNKLYGDIQENIKTIKTDPETGSETLIPINEDDKLRLWRIAEDGSQILVDFEKIENINLDIATLLSRYADGIIYPLPLLEDYQNNDYQTIEQRNFKKTIRWTRVSVFVASAAVLIPAIMSYCSNDTKIIKNAILDNKTEMPAKIEVFTKDTLNVKSVEIPKVIIKPKEK